MSGKRQAETDLNHDNWDQEEESLEVGEFQKAPAEEIQKRIIKTAKRRLADNQSDTPSIFGNFAGFKPITSNTNASASFSFSSSSAATSINGSGSFASPSNMPSSEPLKKTEPTQGNSKSPKYCAELKALNEQLLDWIKTHLTKNPVCILSPIFKDYEKYIRNIEEEDNNEKSASKKNKISFTAPTSVSDVKESNKSIESSPTTTKTTSNSIFGNISANIFTNVVSNPSSKASADLSAAPTTIATTTSGATKFSFGDLSSNTLTSPSFGKGGGFTFGTSSAPFTFSNVTQSSTTQSSGESQAPLEDEEPPKVEFTPVVEEDSKYSKRVKVFFKQDESYSDRGVGTLYIKEVESGAKSQLLVRADTNLGNILLNILLTDGIPLRRLGTNNVMLCCIPTPDAKPPPKSVLLRVKTAAEADELLETIKKYQK